MTNDPMDGLSLPVVPIAPRTEFMTLLRRRVFEGLGVPLSATDREAGMTDITARPLVTPALHYHDATETVEPITENWDHRGRYFIVRDAERTMWQLTTA